MEFVFFPDFSCKNEKQVLLLHPQKYMVIIAQLVRASDCGSEGRGFEPRFSPKVLKCRQLQEVVVSQSEL